MKNISNTQNAKHSNKVTRKQKLAQGRLNWWREPSYRHRLQMHWFNLCLAGFICVELFCLIFMTLFSFGSVGSALAWLIMINYNIPEARRRENESCKHLSLISGYFALKPEKSVVFSSFHCFSLWKENWLSNLNACKARVRQVPVLNLPSVKFCFNPLSFCVNQVTELEKLT